MEFLPAIEGLTDEAAVRTVTRIGSRASALQMYLNGTTRTFGQNDMYGDDSRHGAFVEVFVHLPMSLAGSICRDYLEEIFHNKYCCDEEEFNEYVLSEASP